jgi:hypothetical protein
MKVARDSAEDRSSFTAFFSYSIKFLWAPILDRNAVMIVNGDYDEYLLFFKFTQQS